MAELNFTPENIFINYMKRWTALNVKILYVQDCIVTSTSEIQQAWLRDYKEELETIKQEEKNLIKYEL